MNLKTDFIGGLVLEGQESLENNNLKLRNIKDILTVSGSREL